MKIWNQLTVPALRFETNYSIRDVRIEVAIYSTLAFLIPFAIGSPQLVVGAAVNTLLVLAALNLKQNHWLPLAVLPSLGVLARGLIWGPFFYYLIILLPFIWLANILFISLIQYSMSHTGSSYWTSLLVSAVGKTLLLSVVILALFAFDVVPKPVLILMSVYQLFTALAGGMIATAIQAFRR